MPHFPILIIIYYILLLFTFVYFYFTIRLQVGVAASTAVNAAVHRKSGSEVMVQVKIMCFEQGVKT